MKTVLCKFSSIPDIMFFCKIQKIDEDGFSLSPETKYKLKLDQSLRKYEQYFQNKEKNFILMNISFEKKEKEVVQYQNKFAFIEDVSYEFDFSLIEENAIVITFKKFTFIKIDNFKDVNFTDIKEYVKALSNHTLIKTTNI